MTDLPRNERARELWARTTIRAWPESYRLVSLDPGLAGEAAKLLAAHPAPFAVLVRERGELSLTIAQGSWRRSRLRGRARAEAGPFRAITFELALDHDVVGYLAPAAARLARARIPVVPQCAYHRDHLLVPAQQLPEAMRVLKGLVRDCGRVRTKRFRGRAGRPRPRARA